MFVGGFIGSPQMNFIDGKDLGLDENIIYGIRPDKMITGGEIKKAVSVEIKELLGSEQILYFSVGDRKCSAKVAANYPDTKTIELSINAQDMYKFDKNGNRIY